MYKKSLSLSPLQFLTAERHSMSPQHASYIPGTPTFAFNSSDKDICCGLKPLDAIHRVAYQAEAHRTVPKKHLNSLWFIG